MSELRIQKLETRVEELEETVRQLTAESAGWKEIAFAAQDSLTRIQGVLKLAKVDTKAVRPQQNKAILRPQENKSL